MFISSIRRKRRRLWRRLQRVHRRDVRRADQRRLPPAPHPHAQRQGRGRHQQGLLPPQPRAQLAQDDEHAKVGMNKKLSSRVVG